MKLILFYFHLSLYLYAEAANILALFPFPFFSHTNTITPVLRVLAARGHNVTMVSPYPLKDPPANWTHLLLKQEPLEKSIHEAIIKLTDSNVYVALSTLWNLCATLSEIAYQDETLQKLIRDDSLKFDLVIGEPLFGQESFVAFGHKLKAPFVGFYPLSLSPWATYFSGNPLLSTVPHFRTTYTNHMTFFQRLQNTLIISFELIAGMYSYFPKQEKLMENHMVYRGWKGRPDLDYLLKNIGVHLVDYHYSVGYVQPLLPNTIPIGGLSLMVASDLPPDLKALMDNSANGVIYLSFGSHMKVASLKEEQLDAILATFRRLEVNVLMKWENDTILNKPDNVEIRKWFPQPAILAHPKCRLFITHGGLHSISEAVYHGVPVLGIPFFSDQEFNMKFAEKEGFGYTLLQNQITEEIFRHSIQALLHNKSYKENAVKRSRISKDRALSGMDSAIYWIEYALRHKDLSHLKPATTQHLFYQILQLDQVIVLFLFVLVFIFFISIYYLFKIIIKLLLKRKVKTRKDKKKD